VVRLALDPDEDDWTFGDVLRLRQLGDHHYLYQFVVRKPRFYMDGGRWRKGKPNDRGFVALLLGVENCSYPVSPDLMPCGFDHGGIGKVTSALGGLPGEGGWEMVEPAA
jgi:hypothetical protein